MSHVLFAGAIIFLTAWALLSILGQRFFPQFHAHLAGWTVLPQWNFFAPIPCSADFYLLYRDVFETEEVTLWREVRLARTRKLSNTFWNPDRRVRKAFFDNIVALSETEQKHPKELRLSVPYLNIANYVANLPHNTGIKGTQFAVLTADSRFEGDERRVLVVSDIFSVS